MRIGPLRSYAPSIRRKLLLGAVSSAVLTTFFPGAVFAADFTQSKYRNGATGTEVTNPALLPGWNFSRPSIGYAEGTTNEVVTNKVTAFNANPTSTAGLAGSGAAMVTIVDDSAALAAAGLSGICTSGKVFFANNTTGANAFINIGVAPNTNAHTISAWLRSPTYTAVAMSAGLSSSTVVPITSSYTRQSVTQVAIVAGAAFIRIDANSSFYFILPQWIERGSNIPQDIVTTGAAASINYGQTQNLKLFQSGEPRITSKGLLIEEGRTNVALYSGAPGIGASWANAGGTSTPIDGLDGGTASAARWTEVNSSTGHRPAQNAISIVGGNTYTLSCYVRPGNKQYIRLTSSGSDQVTAVFDMTSKTMVSVGSTLGTPTNVSAGIIPVGTSGWYRVYMTFTASANNGNTTVLIGHAGTGVYNTAADNYVGDPTKYTDFFGFQVETGSFPTSYIPTTTSAATRAADVAWMSNMSSILGQFRTNKLAVYNNNPTNSTGIVEYNGPTLSVVDDPASIAAAGLTALVPSGKLWKVDNSAGASPVNILFTGQSGTVASVTASVYVMGGTGVVGCGNDSGGFTNSFAASFVASPTLVRRTCTGNTDTAARRMILRANAGQVLYFILPQLEDGFVATDPIITQGSLTTVGNPFTVSVTADIPNLDNVGVYLSSIAQGTSINERLVLDRSSTNTARGLMISGGVSQPSNGVNGRTGARVLKITSRNRNTEQRNAFDGVLSATSAITPGSLFDTINFGVSQTRGGNFLCGYIQNLIVYGDVDDTKLAA